MTTNIITAIVTAYCATGHPCADGHMPQTHHTVALPRCFRLGSRVEIDGYWYVGEDRTARRYDGRFDVFVRTAGYARKLGMSVQKVVVVSP